jgi:WXXGXW repeat (2 copies)
MRIFRALIPAVLMLAMLASPTLSLAQISVGVSIGIAPPELPVYEQPPIPGYGYVWTPGYWAYGPDDYYWVPGTWVLPPTIGYLWTPPWWGWSNGFYVWHDGYWGPHVGFYGGINYGFGYFGSGYEGGYWDNGRLFYNRDINNFGGTRFETVYSRPPTHRGFENRVAFNGGTGGISAQESAQERDAARERHLQATSLQTQHIQAAGADPSFRHSVNKGTPAITATSKPAQFSPAAGAAPGGPAGPATLGGQSKGAQGSQQKGVQGGQPTGVQSGQPTGVQGGQSKAVQSGRSKGVQGGQQQGTQGGQSKGVQGGQQQQGTQGDQPKGAQGGQPKGTQGGPQQQQQQQ